MFYPGTTPIQESNNFQNPLLRRERRVVMLHIMVSLFVIILATPVIFLLDSLHQESLTPLFLFFSLLIVGYSIFQILLLRRHHPTIWLLNPAVQYAIMGHIILTSSFVILLFFPVNTLLELEIRFNTNIYYVHVYYQWLNLIAAVALWSGYWSGLANQLACKITKLKVIKKLHRNSIKLNLLATWVIISISAATNLIRIKLGV